jgi:hypothetical protein
MSLGAAIDILAAHQLWRLGLPPYDQGGETPSYTPAELSEAIDLVLAHSRQLILEESARH